MDFAYYEHKFLVSDALLPQVRALLRTLFGNSDPFPEGLVDSLYFDSAGRRSYRECFNGDPLKRKFRLRGYGDGTFSQFHLKQKTLSGVAKVKAHLQPIDLAHVSLPDPFTLLKARPGSETSLAFCAAASASLGVLYPCVRILYRRDRFRVGDDRVTLDSNIEAWALGRNFPFVRDYVRLPWHVVEVKTALSTPRLPLLDVVQLPAASFSKFFLGQQLLSNLDTQFP